MVFIIIDKLIINTTMQFVNMQEYLMGGEGSEAGGNKNVVIYLLYLSKHLHYNILPIVTIPTNMPLPQLVCHIPLYIKLL